MRKHVSISFAFSLLFGFVHAQQTGRYGHEFMKPMVYNPAFTGVGEGMNAMLISRSQWIDFRNSPQQNLFVLDGMLPNEKIGLGVSLFTDRKGISRKTGGDVYYAYHLKLGEEARFSFGISAGVIDHALFYSQAAVEDPTDPMLLGSSQRETSINANAGLRFAWKGLQIGASAPQLLGGTIDINDSDYGKAYYALSRHYLGSLSYRILLSESKQLSITPSAVAHFLPNAPLYYEGNLNFIWKDKFWLGGTYKSEHSIAANAGFCLAKRFSVGYSYDILIGKIAGYGGLAHEIMLNFTFGKAAKKEEKPELNTEADKNKEKLDSLVNELQIKDDQISREQGKVSDRDKVIERLRAENQDLKIAATQPATNENPVTPSVTTPVENTVPAVKNDYTLLGTTTLAPKGYYVIVGAFILRDLAEEELKKYRGSGAKILYSNSKQFHYVAASKHFTKEDAVKAMQAIKASGTTDTWVLTIQD